MRYAMKFSKIIIGTANFVNPYGLKGIKLSSEIKNLSDIFILAGSHKVKYIDTAVNYGDIFQLLNQHTTERPFNIINKFSPNHSKLEDIDFDRTDVLLIHINPTSPVVNDELFNIFKSLKEKQPSLKVGVSIYDESDVPAQIYDLCDVIQLPLSILDHQLLTGGFISRMKSKGKEIHVRSVFLQGILLEDAQFLPDKLEPLKKPISKFHQYCKSYDYSPFSACLSFVLNNELIDGVVVGFNSLVELEQILHFDKQNTYKDIIVPKLEISSPDLLKPYNW